MRLRRRDLAAGAWMVIAVAAAGSVLWYEDARYGRPTPRPAGLADPPIGTHVQWPEAVAQHLVADRPALLHVFNPDCPCSRFNLDHVRGLWAHYGADLDVVLVVESAAAASATLEISGLPVPVVHDADGRIADLAGVYSTPNAVVLDRRHTVAYVGNYTVTRYCTDPDGEPARIAIERILGIAPADGAPIDAPVPFGCPLPSDVENDGDAA